MDIPHKVFTKKRENEVDENQMYNFRLLYIFKWWNLSSLAFEYYTRFMRFCVFFPFSSTVCDSIFVSSWESCPERQSVILYSFRLLKKKKITFIFC